MSDQWYYARHGHKLGPFSSTQLKDLASAGEVLPTDSIWKEGVEKGVPAAMVKNLFRPAEVSTPLATPSASAAAATGTGEAADQALLGHSAAPSAPASTPKKGRAVVIRGAVIVTQDGTMVHYRKKCARCGYEDSSKSRLPIRSGVTRSRFFCRKCRRQSPVEIQGWMI